MSTKPAVPQQYMVRIHNDDFTTFDFVIFILERYFQFTLETAAVLADIIHEKGAVDIGPFSREIAETKTYQITKVAQRHGFPFKLTFQPVDEEFKAVIAELKSLKPPKTTPPPVEPKPVTQVGRSILPNTSAIPSDSKSRKDIPIVRGCLDYFPAALAEVAKLSLAGNLKHNPGEELYHARSKSSDHADCIVRHLMDRGTIDNEDGIRHSVKLAWRALALLQEELEKAGLAPLARGAKK